jgi:hypothetical protein
MQWNIFSDSDAPPTLGQEPVPPTPMEPVKKSRKKLYVLIGAVAVAAVLIAVVLGSISPVPQGLGENIPYSLSFNVGENLTYSLSATVSANGQQVTETGNMNMSVVSFDGENYTINEPTHIEAEGVPYDTSVTLIMNKAGQMVGTPNLPSQLQNAYSIIQGSPMTPMFFNRTEIQVGQTYKFPISFSNSTMNISGTVNIKVADIENVTVPAGTYKTFKLELSTSNFQVSSQGNSATLSVTAQVRMDYTTCHVIDLSLQETGNAEGSTMSLTMNMALTADTTQ